MTDINNSSQKPTILIKKSDGTSVRVTLDEFKKMRNVNTVEQNSVKEPQTEFQNSDVDNSISDIDTREETKIEQNIQVDDVTKDADDKFLPEINSPHELTTTTPVKDIFIDEAKAKLAWKPEDHRSPLEEDNSEINLLKKQGIEHTIPQVQIEKNSSLVSHIPKELMSRFNALVLSYKKGVRSDEQFIEYILRDPSQGGLGFTTEEEAKMLLDEVKQKTKVIQKKNVPSLERESLSVVNTVAPKFEQDLQTSGFTMPPQQTQKPVQMAPSVVHDMVQPNVSKTVGPEEEIGNFSLIDFRRLSKDPKVAASMILAKFEGWKKESFLLFMKTRDSWKKSPLYLQYINLTVEACNERVPVKDLSLREQKKGGIKFEEYIGLVDVNSGLMV